MGAVATAGVYVSGQWAFAGYQVGATALTLAHAKVQHEFLAAFMLGVFCNALVYLAVWLSFSARMTTDKILALVPPITAFVAAGFEHSIANMYVIQLGLWLRADARVLARTGHAPQHFAELTWGGVREQPGAGDPGQPGRRRRAGSSRLLVCLSAAAAGWATSAGMPSA